MRSGCPPDAAVLLSERQVNGQQPSRIQTGLAQIRTNRAIQAICKGGRGHMSIIELSWIHSAGVCLLAACADDQKAMVLSVSVGETCAPFKRCVVYRRLTRIEFEARTTNLVSKWNCVHDFSPSRLNIVRLLSDRSTSQRRRKRPAVS